VTAQATDASATGARATPLLAVEAVDVVLGRGWRANQVLSGVDLKIWPGEIVGLVGETGSGKTTLARTVVGLVKPRKGRVVVDGTEVSSLRRGALRKERRSGHVQLVFQDPLRSLDPDLTVAEIVGEGLKIRGGIGSKEIETRVTAALQQVGLDATLLSRTPGQISGGQRQRVSIARALATDPRLLLCDEPVSALDASNRNYILRLLGDLRDNLGLPIVIISHDLSSLAGIADRVAVLYRGRIVEDGPVGQVFSAPRHPYTALLMASAPSVKHDRPLDVHQLRRTPADPEPPSARNACVFAPRCAFAVSECAEQPALETVAEGWAAACRRHQEWPALARTRRSNPTPAQR
jgi:oligopeptide/dipeptide ABC transporter ATP-binding protein